MNERDITRHDALTPMEALGLLHQDWGWGNPVDVDEVMHHLTRLWREV